MRISEPTTKIWMKIDPYYQQQKCRPRTLVSGGIRFMRIFAEIPWRGGVKRQWGCPERQLSAFSLAMFSETLKIEASIIIYIAIRSPSSAFQWFQNAWPWLTALNSVKTAKDRHILSAAKIFGRDSSFWQYKACADIRSGSLEKRR